MTFYVTAFEAYIDREKQTYFIVCILFSILFRLLCIKLKEASLIIIILLDVFNRRWAHTFVCVYFGWWLIYLFVLAYMPWEMSFKFSSTLNFFFCFLIFFLFFTQSTDQHRHMKCIIFFFIASRFQIFFGFFVQHSIN